MRGTVWMVWGLLGALFINLGGCDPENETSGFARELSWQNHPGGGPLNLPAGDYTTPNRQQCGTGCVVWAAHGALEMQFKIDQANPDLSVNLNPYGFLGQYSGGSVCGGVCGENSSTGDSFEIDCTLEKLRDDGTPRSDGGAPLIYKITSFTEINPITNQIIWDQLQFGPILTNMRANDGGSIVNCSPSTGDHEVVIIGYRETSGGAVDVQIKNSWADTEGTDSFPWLEIAPNNGCNIFFNYRTHYISGTYVDDQISDTDEDGFEDYIDMCPEQSSYTNTNIDGDYQGDACDNDRDGDFVLNFHDCQPDNKYIAYDLDGDFKCEPYFKEVGGDPYLYWKTLAFEDCPGLDTGLQQCCLDECGRLDGLGLIFFSRSDCEAACNQVDNCTPINDGNTICKNVYKCLTQDNQSVGSCDTIQLGVLNRKQPWPADVDVCRNQYGNMNQSDVDGDGLGDFCDDELMINNLALTGVTYTAQGSSGGLRKSSLCFTGRYDISFDSWGGGPEGVTRTGTSVGACYCPRDPWDATCTDECPLVGEAPLSDTNDNAWDPIISYDCTASLYPANGTQAADDELANRFRDRSVIFGPSLANHHFLEWDWANFSDPEDNYAAVDVAWDPSSQGTVKIRVDYPDGNAAPSEEEKAFIAQGVPIKTGCSVTSIGYQQWEGPPVEIIPWDCSGAWLGGLALIPGSYWAPLAAGLVQNLDGGIYQVVIFEQSLSRPLQILKLQTGGTGAIPDLRQSKWAAGMLKPELIGLPGGKKVPALIILNENKEAGAAQLWFAILTNEDPQLVSGVDILGASAIPPDVVFGEIIFDDTQQQVLLAGRLSENSQLGLWGLDMATGEWMSRGSLEAPADLTGFRLVRNPNNDYLFLFGGRTADSEWPALQAFEPVSNRRIDMGTGSGEVLPLIEDPGIHQNCATGEFTLYGGTIGDDPNLDIWKIGPMGLLTEKIETGRVGPTARIRPMVFSDGNMVWVSGGEIGSNSPAFVAWRFDPEASTWREYRPLDPDAITPNSMSGIFAREAPAAMLFNAGADGHEVTASLEAGGADLGIVVRKLTSGQVVGSAMNPDEPREVLFSAESEADYAIEIHPFDTFPADAATNFSINVQ
jgi:hypothetical protein